MNSLDKVKKAIEQRLDFMKKISTSIIPEEIKEQAIIELEFALSRIICAEKGVL